MELLILLVEKQGQMATRDEIAARLWGKRPYFDADRGINTAIRKIRLALSDDPDQPQCVETVIGRGYRFIAPIKVTPAFPLPDNEGVTRKNGWPADAGGLRTGSPSHRGPLSRSFRPGLVATAGIAIALVILAGVRWQWLARTPAPQAIQAIAVLPFHNLSGDPSQEYLADGLTEALITGLGQASPLRIISHTSVVRYQGTKKAVPEIARELNVDAVIEGTVALSGSHLRVTANLIHGFPERHLWARSYEREIRDTLSLENELASAIVLEVQGKLTPLQRFVLGDKPPASSEAQMAYLKSRFFLHVQRSRERARKSVEYSQQAIRIDPNYALGYAGLAESYASLSFLGAPRTIKKKHLEKAAAQRALSLDEKLGQAHTALGQILQDYDWDWAGSERELRRALELNPNDSDARQFLANYLVKTGRTEEAIAEIRRARANDPLSLWINRDLGRILYFAGKYDEAIAELRQTVELDPSSTVVLEFLGGAYLAKGLPGEAFTSYLRWKMNQGWSENSLTALRSAYAAAGLMGYWKKAREITQENRGSDEAYALAKLSAYLGDRDQAFAWLEDAYRQRLLWMTWIKVDPSLETLHGDPRFRSILRRVGLH